MQINLPVSQKILTGVAQLDEFRGRWGLAIGIPAERLERMAEAARIQSVAASCRLAGIRVSDMEVAGLLRGQDSSSRDAADVLGYGAAASAQLPGPDKLLRPEDLRRMHAVMASGAKDDLTLSPWRTVHHQREAFDAQGRATGRVFSTLPPRMIEGKVEDLLTWLEFELRSAESHPVLVVGAFIVGFLAACPFATLNGRMSRILIPQLLLRVGYTHIPLASIEARIEELRPLYHDAFDHSQTRYWQGEADLEAWCEFIVEIVTHHREKVEQKAALERDVLEYPPLQRAILEAVREHGDVDAGLLLKATGANRNTLKDNLRKLCDRGILEKSGERRGTRYQMAGMEAPRPAVFLDKLP